MISAKVSIGLTGDFYLSKGKKWQPANHKVDTKNIVLDVGWGHLRDSLMSLGSGHAPLYLHMGTGTTEPTAADAGLESVSSTLGGKVSTSRRKDIVGDSGYVAIRQKFEYGEGEAEGVWTELGLAYDAAYTKPYNRSLIRDENGAPSSITVLSDEWLEVWVEIRMYFSAPGEGVISGVIDYNGTTHTYTSTADVTGYVTGNFYDGNTIDASYSVQYGLSLWEFGFKYYSVAYENNLSNDNHPMTLAADGSMTFEYGGESYNPGGLRSISRIAFGNYFSGNGRVYYHVLLKVDPPISIPSDHKSAVGPMSISFERGAVPL